MGVSTVNPMRDADEIAAHPGTPAVPLSVTTSVVRDSVVVAAVGEVDAVTVPRLRTALRTALGRRLSHRVVLDLSAVDFLGSHGLAMLVDIAAHAESAGMPFCLVVGDRHVVIRALRVTGLAAVFALYPSLADAPAP